MAPIIIGLNGLKGTGKSTVAEYLKKNYNFEEYAFADSLKRACIEIFGLEEKQVFGSQIDKEAIDSFWGTSPRIMLQQVGTAIRNLNNPLNNIWIRNLQRKIKIRIENNSNVYIVVSDIRYKDEAKLIKDMGGIIINIKRHTNYIDHHESEQQIINADFIISNDDTKKNLFSCIDDILRFVIN